MFKKYYFEGQFLAMCGQEWVKKVCSTSKCLTAQSTGTHARTVPYEGGEIRKIQNG